MRRNFAKIRSEGSVKSNSSGRYESIKSRQLKNLSWVKRSPDKPLDVRDRIYNRIAIKMSKQFGTHERTTEIIHGVLDANLKGGKPLHPSDFDRIENEIFHRLQSQN